MSQDAPPKPNIRFVFLLAALTLVAAVALSQSYNLPLLPLLSVTLPLLFLMCIGVVHYQARQARKQVDREIAKALARMRTQEYELNALLQKNGLPAASLSLPAAAQPTAPTAMDSETLRIANLQATLRKSRGSIWIGIPMFGLCGFGSLAGAWDDWQAGVLSYTVKGPPPVHYTVSAQEGALQFYTQIAFMGSLGIFALTLAAIVLCLLPIMLFPRRAAGYFRIISPVLRYAGFAALPFGAIFILLLPLRPLILN